MTAPCQDRARLQAERQKRYKRRQRRGEAIYGVMAGEAVLEALIAAHRLEPEETVDRDRVGAAIGEIVQEWARRWVGTRNG